MVGHKDVKAKEGVILKAGQNSKKVDFFTGKNLLQALRRQQSPFAFADDADAKKAHGSYKKLQRKIKKDQEKNESTEDQDVELIAAMRRIKKVAQREAKEIAQALFERRAYFIRCEVTDDKASHKKIVELIPPPKKSTALEFDSTHEYVWVYQGSHTKRTMFMMAIVIAFLACCMFPIWPNFMKVGVWYLSVTFLILLFIIVVIRTISFAVMWSCGYTFWILPNLFAEVGILESFQPTWWFDKSSPAAWYWRVIAFIIFAIFGYWVYQQPTDFDEYRMLQRQFIDDLYSGKMITDMSQSAKENLDEIKVPTFEEMENLFQEDEADAAESSILDALVDGALDEEGYDQAAEDAADAAMDAAADAKEAAAAAALGDADASTGESAVGGDGSSAAAAEAAEEL